MHRRRANLDDHGKLSSQQASSALSRASDDGIDLRKLAARQILPLGFACAIVWLLWDNVAGLDTNHIKSALRTVAPHQWALAALFSAISFWALGRYDRVVHRLIGSTTKSGAAQRAGVTAIALSQTVGMGVLSSALVRWRMLPELSLVQAMRISVIVSVSFLSAWAVVASCVALLVPLALPGSVWMAWGVLAVAGVLVSFSIFRPSWLARLKLPSLKAMGAFVGLAAIDTFAAGAALWAVMPEDCAIGLVPLVAAYLIALGAGLISGTPGGVGPFEVTLLALLPQLETEPVLAAILAFRAVYYAVPAVLAAAVTIRGPVQTPHLSAQHNKTPAQLTKITPTALSSSRLATAIETAPRAETALLRQGCLDLLETPNGFPAAMAKPIGQSLVVVSDPFQTTQVNATFLSDVTQVAHDSYLSPFFYKIGGRMAAIARSENWKTLPIAREAWISPQSFTQNGSKRRQLRRKLRQSEKAGVCIQIGGANLPLKDMEDIAHAWRTRRGGERGFSMGIWKPETLPHSQVYLAYQNNALIGFITLHKNRQEQVLDLMRMKDSAPDGTMHMLVCAALKNAAKQNCPRLSLAAVPLGPRTKETPVIHQLRVMLDRVTGASGLRQFKTSFAPNWETLYMAAPTRIGLILGALDIAREISQPSTSSSSPTEPEPLIR